jgi:hypothetical protein
MVTRKPALEKQEHGLSLHIQVNQVALFSAGLRPGLRNEPQLQRSHRKTAGSTAAREIVFSPSHWRNVSRCQPE